MLFRFYSDFSFSDVLVAVVVVCLQLSKDVFETRTATGRRAELLLVCSELKQSVGKPSF